MAMEAEETMEPAAVAAAVDWPIADETEEMAEVSCRRCGRSGEATTPEMARKGRR